MQAMVRAGERVSGANGVGKLPCTEHPKRVGHDAREFETVYLAIAGPFSDDDPAHFGGSCWMIGMRRWEG